MSTERIPVIPDDFKPKPKKKRAVWPRLLIGLLMALIAGLAAYGLRDWFGPPIENFGVVREGVLYRSVQPSLHGIASAAARYGIWTVVDARPLGQVRNDPRAEAEAFYCRNHNMSRVVLGEGSATELIERFLKIVTTRANQPVLVYDATGARTASLLCAAYRIHEQSWTVEQAVAEMARYGASPAETAPMETILKACAAEPDTKGGQE